MSKPKLYLHVGTHKTGTSAIQDFCYKHQDLLMQQGVYYPDYKPLSDRLNGGHHSIAHGLAEESRVLSYEEVKQLVNLWHLVCLKRNCSMLISAEAMYRQTVGRGGFRQKRANYLARLVELFDAFDVTVVMVFRRPDDYIRSWYQERVMRSSRALPEFEQFRISRLASGVNYSHAAETFLKHFSNVKAYTYEELNEAHGGVVGGFLQAIGVAIGDTLPDKRVRQSLTVPQTLIKAYANKKLLNSAHAKRFVKWLKGEEGAAVVAEYFDPQVNYSLWKNNNERQQFLDSRADDIQRLSHLLFADKDEIFPPLENASRMADASTRPVAKQFCSTLQQKIDAAIAKCAPKTLSSKG